MKTEAKSPVRFLTLERQMCVLCLAQGERVKVWDWAIERRTGNWKLRQRNAIARHLRTVHPDAR